MLYGIQATPTPIPRKPTKSGASPTPVSIHCFTIICLNPPTFRFS